MTALADFLPRTYLIRGILGAVMDLGIIAVGGLILGLITGVCIAWMVPHKAAV